MTSQLKEVILKHSTIAVALKCNLKCKLCLTASPYYEDPPIYSIEMLTLIVDNFFPVVDYVEKLTLTGGEPFLNKNISDFIVYLKTYSSQIDFIEVITNGTILPTENFIQACKEFGKIVLLVDDYGPNISRNAGKFVEVLVGHDISVKRRTYYGENAHMGGWVDFGDLTLKNESDEAAEELFSACAYSQSDNICFGIYGGKVSLCSVSRRCAELGITDVSAADEILDLLDDSIPVEKKKEWFLASEHRTKLEACRYCNGMRRDSPRYMPAEQES